VTDATTSIITVRDVIKQFGRFAALRGVTAEFDAGRFHAILGDNGAGKTTLLRALAGLANPTRGEIEIFGKSPKEACRDLGYMAHPSLLYDEGLTAPHDHGYCFGPVVIHPTSRGRVMLRAPLPHSKPRVVCNFLTTPEDRATVIAGLRIALEIAAQPALQAVEREPYSVPESDSDEDLLAFAQRAGQTVYHPTSTCAIGSVVDGELRVYGFEGLRVADASVMPTITRGNTHAATIMIGEKAADLVRAG